MVFSLVPGSKGLMDGALGKLLSLIGTHVKFSTGPHFCLYPGAPPCPEDPIIFFQGTMTDPLCFLNAMLPVVMESQAMR